MCTEIEFATKQRGEIASVGGTDRFLGVDQPWGLSRAEAVQLIESGRWSFFVRMPGETPPRAKVQVAQRNGTKYLRTEADTETRNNLGELPEQGLELTGRPPPGLSSGLPGAREPKLIGLYSDARPTPLAGPNADGVFPVRPSRHIFIRFSAPFSNEYDVSVDGGFPLFRAPSATTSLPEPLEQNGWWALTRMGYFGASIPPTLQIDRDNTLYEIRVRLPEAVVGAPLVSILLAQISLNRNCIQPEDRSSSLVLALSRFDAPLLGPTLPPAGTEMIFPIKDPTGRDQFDVMNPGLDPTGALAGARITTVTNISRDINGDPTTVHFFSISHTEPAGTTPAPLTRSGPGSGTTPFLPAGATTSLFSRMLVNGRWTLRVGPISAVFFDERTDGFMVRWTRP